MNTEYETFQNHTPDDSAELRSIATSLACLSHESHVMTFLIRSMQLQVGLISSVICGRYAKSLAADGDVKALAAFEAQADRIEKMIEAMLEEMQRHSRAFAAKSDAS